jgi:F0F1-type ATP synthase assembly protein I
LLCWWLYKYYVVIHNRMQTIKDSSKFLSEEFGRIVSVWYKIQTTCRVLICPQHSLWHWALRKFGSHICHAEACFQAKGHFACIIWRASKHNLGSCMTQAIRNTQHKILRISVLTDTAFAVFRVSVMVVGGYACMCAHGYCVLLLVSCLVYYSTPKMGVMYSSRVSGYLWAVWYCNPEDHSSIFNQIPACRNGVYHFGDEISII